VTISYPGNQPLSPPELLVPPSGAGRPRLTFLGTGYLGATYAICFAEMGYEVLGFDVDEPKIAKLAGGEVPFHEPGLDELLRKNLATGRLRFSTSYDDVADFGDVLSATHWCEISRCPFQTPSWRYSCPKRARSTARMC